MNKINIQKPTIVGNWLYQDQETGRYFSELVFLGKEAQPWPECTNEEKEQWEREHAPAVPEPENEQ